MRFLLLGALLLTVPAAVLGWRAVSPVSVTRTTYDFTAGSFARASIAYAGERLGALSQVAANVRRNQTVVVSSNPEVAIRSAQGPSSKTMLPQVIINGVIYGIYAVTADRTGIYKTVDGTTWTTVNAVQKAERIELGANNRMIAFDYDGSNATCYWSDDLGVTWTRAQNGAGADMVFGNGLTSHFKSTKHYFRYGSVICYGTYGGGEQRFIYRSSDNGTNWTAVLDVGVKPSADATQHCHMIARHAGTGVWVSAWGDGRNRQWWTSIDEGMNWVRKGYGDEWYSQPVAWCDYGHATRALVGSDSNGGVSSIDVASLAAGTGPAEKAVWNFHNTANENFCWTIYRHTDGVIYAFQQDEDFTGPTYPCIAASPDNGANWVTIHRFDSSLDAVGGAVIGGAASVAGLGPDGLLHGVMIYRTAPSSISYAEFTLRPVTLRSLTGLVLEAGMTNLISTAAQSTGDSATNFHVDTNQTLTVTSQADGAVHTPNALVADDGTSTSGVLLFYRIYNSGLASGQAFQFRHRSKMDGGKYPVEPESVIEWKDATTYFPATSRYYQGTDAYDDVRTSVVTCGSGVTLIRFWAPQLYERDTVQGGGADNATITMDVPMLVRVDTEQPGTWQVGGTPRTAETFSATVSGGTDEWSALVSVMFPSRKADFDALTANLFLWTWYKDANCWASLYWSPSDDTFKLRYTENAGGAYTTLTTTAKTWYDWATMRFLLRVESSRLALSVWDGRSIEHVSVAFASPAIRAASLTLKAGDHAGANLMNHVVAEGFAWDASLSDDEAAGLISSASPSAYPFVHDRIWWR